MAAIANEIVFIFIWKKNTKKYSINAHFLVHPMIYWTINTKDKVINVCFVQKAKFQLRTEPVSHKSMKNVENTGWRQQVSAHIQKPYELFLIEKKKIIKIAWFIENLMLHKFGYQIDCFIEKTEQEEIIVWKKKKTNGKFYHET